MSKNYKLIVIEGVDASGKQTQSDLLYAHLCSDGVSAAKIGFPNYDSASSALVKMYLNGDFGTDAEAINPYAASAFFAVDRVASIFGDWREKIENSDVVIADRYVTSNMIHQASKIKNEAEKSAFLDWLYDFEYEKLKLPKPNLVIFLDMPAESAMELMKKRPNKIDMSDVKDIHESDFGYLKSSYDNAVSVAKRCDWKTVRCVKDGSIRTADDIADEIYGMVKSVL